MLDFYIGLYIHYYFNILMTIKTFEIIGTCFKLYQVYLFTKSQTYLLMFSRLGASAK